MWDISSWTSGNFLINLLIIEFQEQLRQEENGGGGRGVKRSFDDVDESSEEEEPNDEVRLWEDGFKDRYYESKFDVPKDDIAFRLMVSLGKKHFF